MKAVIDNGASSAAKEEKRDPQSRSWAFMQFLNNPRTGETLIGVEDVRDMCTGGRNGEPKSPNMVTWFYILHDKDKYRPEDVEGWNKREHDKTIAEPAYKTLPCPYVVGEVKPPHIHGGSSKYSLDWAAGDKRPTAPRLSTMAGICPKLPAECWVRSKNQGTDAMALMLAYAIHDPRLGETTAGKHVYDWDELVTNIPDPKGLVDAYFEKRDAKNHKHEVNKILREVTLGHMTVREAKAEMISWGADGSWENYRDKIHKARTDFLNDCKPPALRVNIYIEGAPGTGKSFLGTVLARAIARQLYPDNKCSDADLVFTVNGKNVAFEGYDGEHVMLWDDMRGKQIVATLGGRGNVFRAFEIHPNDNKQKAHKKFGDINFLQEVNIVTAAEPFEDFIAEMSGLGDSFDDDGGHDLNQEEQTRRRFGFWIKVDEKYLEAYYRSGLLGESFRVPLTLLHWDVSVSKLAESSLSMQQKTQALKPAVNILLNGDHGVVKQIEEQKKHDAEESNMTGEEWLVANHVPAPVILPGTSAIQTVDAEFSEKTKFKTSDILSLDECEKIYDNPREWIELHSEADDDKYLNSATLSRIRDGRQARELATANPAEYIKNFSELADELYLDDEVREHIRGLRKNFSSPNFNGPSIAEQTPMTKQITMDETVSTENAENSESKSPSIIALSSHSLPAKDAHGIPLSF